jgi:regulator of protease activity HflC (stomatin/prohibitin superfamily)
MFREIPRKATPGLAALLILILFAGLAAWQLVNAARVESALAAVLWALVLVLALVGMGGLFIVQPNDSKVLTLFGRYAGSIRESGLWWANPFLQKRRISLRVRNFETAKLKVNDNHSNPIEIAAIVVWRVIDTAEAMFEVDDYTHYVVMQAESAVRALAQTYPYDAHAEGQVSLSTDPSEVSKALQDAIAARLLKAGVEVVEARISHLAYAPEIASAMLRRQQAAAIIAARQKIVEGAVGMVENALSLISDKSLVTLDDDRKAAMISNLLVVLCSDRDAQPVLNTGTIYQ